MSLFGERRRRRAAPLFDERAADPRRRVRQARAAVAREGDARALRVSDHPLMGAEASLRRKTDGTLTDLAEMRRRATIRTFGGVVTALNASGPARATCMAVFALEDLQPSVEVIGVPEDDDRPRPQAGRRRGGHGPCPAPTRPREDQPKLIAMEIEPFEPLSGEIFPPACEGRPRRRSEMIIGGPQARSWPSTPATPRCSSTWAIARSCGSPTTGPSTSALALLAGASRPARDRLRSCRLTRGSRSLTWGFAAVTRVLELRQASAAGRLDCRGSIHEDPGLESACRSRSRPRTAPRWATRSWPSWPISAPKGLLPHEIGVLSKQAEAWVLTTQARENGKLKGFAFSTPGAHRRHALHARRASPPSSGAPSGTPCCGRWSRTSSGGPCWPSRTRTSSTAPGSPTRRASRPSRPSTTSSPAPTTGRAARSGPGPARSPSGSASTPAAYDDPLVHGHRHRVAPRGVRPREPWAPEALPADVAALFKGFNAKRGDSLVALRLGDGRRPRQARLAPPTPAASSPSVELPDAVRRGGWCAPSPRSPPAGARSRVWWTWRGGPRRPVTARAGPFVALEGPEQTGPVPGRHPAAGAARGSHLLAGSGGRRRRCRGPRAPRGMGWSGYAEDGQGRAGLGAGARRLGRPVLVDRRRHGGGAPAPGSRRRPVLGACFFGLFGHEAAVLAALGVPDRLAGAVGTVAIGHPNAGAAAGAAPPRGRRPSPTSSTKARRGALVTAGDRRELASSPSRCTPRGVGRAWPRARATVGLGGVLGGVLEQVARGWRRPARSVASATSAMRRGALADGDDHLDVGGPQALSAQSVGDDLAVAHKDHRAIPRAGRRRASLLVWATRTSTLLTTTSVSAPTRPAQEAAVAPDHRVLDDVRQEQQRPRGRTC